LLTCRQLTKSAINHGTPMASRAAESTGAEGVAWDLSDLYASLADPALEADADEALAAAGQLRERYAGRLAHLQPAEIVEVLEQLERIDELAYRVWSFAQLSFAADTHNGEAARLVQRAEERRTAVATELRFFDLEWAAAGDDLAGRVLDQPSVARYREYLT